MMQAVLILAHNHIEQVTALAKALHTRFAVYIHLDKKYHVSDAELQQLMALERVHVFQAIDVHWGGFSIGEAELLLMKEAMKDPDVTYVHIISGQDWPVKKVDAIYGFYENTDAIYMTWAPAKGVVKSHEPIILWQQYYFHYDDMNRRSLYGKLYHRWTMFWQTLMRVNKFKDLGISYEIYQGANWCDLPRYAVEYILKYMDNHPEYRRMLKTGCFSDEVLCQTILCNSPYRDKIANDNHRYIKWEKQYNSYPAILDERDLPEINGGEYHFARKIDLIISKKLIDKLKENNSDCG